MRDVGEEIIESCSGWSHGGKLCKCKTCGIVRRCTYNFDFYAKNDGDPLECERCMRGRAEADGFDTSKLEEIEEMN